VIDRQSQAEEYCETAAKLRRIAVGMNPGDAQTEIVELCERFERLAELTKRESRTDSRDIVGRALPPSRFVVA